MTRRRATTLLSRLFLGSACVLLAGAGCSSGGSGTALKAVTTTSEPTTTTTAVPAAPVASSSTTLTTEAPTRRPTPTTASSRPSPAAHRAPAPTAPSTTTTTEWQVPAENLVKGPGPEFSDWTPPSDVPAGSVHNVWTPAPGVEMTPPYQAPSVVGAVEYLGCTRENDTNLWRVQVLATLTGGRYWRFPSHASGYTGIFPSVHQSMVGDDFDPDGFDGSITYVTVETGAGTRQDVPISPLKFHCAP